MKLFNYYKQLQVPNKEPCRRAWIFIGTICNVKCSFCYYKSNLTLTKRFEEIKWQIDLAKRVGMTSVDISGGEPTVHPDYFKILEYATKQFGRVSILSNGIRLSDEDFLKRSIDLGLNEILFSLHGTETVYNKIVTGGSFSKAVRAIELAKKHNLRVRINHTLTGLSLQYIKDYIKIINDLEPFQVNFIPENTWDDNCKRNRRNEWTKKLNDYLDMISKNVEVNIRYVPFCLVEKKEFVVGYLQHIFDKYDWAPLFSYLRNNPSFQITDFIYDSYRIQVDKIITRNYKKKSCITCRYFLICDGLQKLSDDVHPVPSEGEYIRTPVVRW